MACFVIPDCKDLWHSTVCACMCKCGRVRVFVCVWAADVLYGSLLYLFESESLTDPGTQRFRQIDDQRVPEPTDSFICLFPSPVLRTRLRSSHLWSSIFLPCCPLSLQILILRESRWWSAYEYTLLCIQHPTRLMTSSRCSTYICQLTNCPWESESTHFSEGAI